MSVRATSNPTRTRSRARIVTRSNWSVPVNGGIVWKCRIGPFRRRAICSFTREVMLKLTMDYKMTKHMLNNCTIKGSRTWLLVCTRHCYFIPFNREHPVANIFRTHTTYFNESNDVVWRKKSWKCTRYVPRWRPGTPAPPHGCAPACPSCRWLFRFNSFHTATPCRHNFPTSSITLQSRAGREGSTTAGEHSMGCYPNSCDSHRRPIQLGTESAIYRMSPASVR